MELTEKNLDAMSINNTLLYIAQTVLDGKRLDEEEQWYIKDHLNQRFMQLYAERDLVFQQIRNARYRDISFTQQNVRNQKEKLDVILLRSGIPDHILAQITRTNPDHGQRIRDYRATKRNEKLRDENLEATLLSYGLDVDIFTRGGNANVLLIAKKNRKLYSGIAESVPRRIVEEKAKRACAGETTEYILRDGIINDIVGVQYVSLKPYEPGGDNAIEDILGFLTNPRSNVTVLEIDNHYLKPIQIEAGGEKAEYGAIHTAVKPILGESAIINPENVDTIEVQLTDIPNFLKKEIGTLNQILYKIRQKEFRGRKLPKAAQECVTDTDRLFIKNCYEAIMGVLTYRAGEFQ